MFICAMIHRREILELFVAVLFVGVEILKNANIGSADLMIRLIDGQRGTNEKGEESDGPYVVGFHSFLDQFLESSGHFSCVVGGVGSNQEHEECKLKHEDDAAKQQAQLVFTR